MAKSSKLVAAKRGRVLLVRRKRDRLWMFPGGRKRAQENDIACAEKSKKNFRNQSLDVLGFEVKAKNRRSGRKMSDSIFVTAKGSGRLTIGDKQEIDKATWRKPRGIRDGNVALLRDKLFPKSK
jgi:8-oxo-dGTP diphosphatase